MLCALKRTDGFELVAIVAQAMQDKFQQIRNANLTAQQLAQAMEYGTGEGS